MVQKLCDHLENILTFFLQDFVTKRLNKGRRTGMVSNGKVTRRCRVIDDKIGLFHELSIKFLNWLGRIPTEILKIHSWEFTFVVNCVVSRHALQLNSSPRQNCARISFGIPTNSDISGSSSLLNWIDRSENSILKFLFIFIASLWPTNHFSSHVT